MPHKVVTTYLDAINASDPEALSRMFAPDAVHLGPDGLRRVGREAIRAFYADVFRRGRHDMTPGRIVVDGARIVFELISRLSPLNADDPAMAIDLIEVDENGLITSFVVFHRPKSAGT